MAKSNSKANSEWPKQEEEEVEGVSPERQRERVRAGEENVCCCWLIWGTYSSSGSEAGKRKKLFQLPRQQANGGSESGGGVW